MERVHFAWLCSLIMLLLWCAGLARSGKCDKTISLPSLFFSPVLDPASIPRWSTRVPNPLSASSYFVPRSNVSGFDFYRIGMRQISQQMLPAGCPPTSVFAYGNADDPFSNPRSFSSPARTILASVGRATVVEWVHTQLPRTHLLPIDRTVHCGSTVVNCTPDVRTVPHLHGGHVAWEADGFPEAWQAADGSKGPLFVSNRYTYSNDQEGATLWYHDHAPGITRLNVYAGLAGLYILRSAHDAMLQLLCQLPSAPYDMALVIQDRFFYPNGSLAYPDTPTWAPYRFTNMVFGNVFVVNGVAWPRWRPEPRPYRVRLVNGCNGRHLALRWTSTSTSTGPGRGTVLPVVQIASDGGFLDASVNVSNETLVLGPGERAEYVIDFSDARPAEVFVLTNSAAAPYPAGMAPDPLMREVLLVNVSRPLDPRRVKPRLALPLQVTAVPRLSASALAALPTRKVMLYQTIDPLRPRILNMLGTPSLGPLHFSDSKGITEHVALNATEIWEVYNPTSEAHPVHLHLVMFQVIDRANIASGPDNIPRRGNIAFPVLPGEQGPKDTVRVDPGTVVRLVATFDRPGLFMWHCHMLEHEDSDMMRPLCVGGPGACPTTWIMNHTS